MASQVKRGTFLFAPVQLKSPDRKAFTLVKQDELSLKVLGFIGSGRGDSSRVASFPKQRVSGQLIAEEDLWLADTREFLSNCPEWPMAEATGMQAEGAPMLSNICILKILLGKDEGP